MGISAELHFSILYSEMVLLICYSGSYNNWLMLVVKEVDTDGLMFDGQPFSTLGPQWKAFPGNSHFDKDQNRLAESSV